jgi:diguanylate cyclase (GGDEF)-like protein
MPLTPAETVPPEDKRQGYLRIRFGEELEREYDASLAETRIGQVRLNLALAAVLIVGFGVLEVMTNGAAPVRTWVLLDFAGMVLLASAAIGVTFLSRGAVLYPRISEALALTLGLLAVGGDVWGRSAGSPRFFTTTFLVTLYTYHLMGLFCHQAVRVNLLIWAAGAICGVLSGIPVDGLVYNLASLALINAVGAITCLNGERERRSHFLERRILAATAARDGLTGLNNRRRFDEHLETVWQLAQRDGVPLALLLIDIDFFKRFNDWHGHQAGDQCLKAVAVALTRSARRPLDFTARYGGEEFAVILYHASRSYVVETAATIQANIAALAIPHGDSDIGSSVTVSIGIAHVAPSLHRSAQGFVQLADQALYQAKAEGRNRSVSNEAAYNALQTGIFRIERRNRR